MTLNAPADAVRAADYILFVIGQDEYKVVIDRLKDHEVWCTIQNADLGVLDQKITSVRLRKSG